MNIESEETAMQVVNLVGNDNQAISNELALCMTNIAKRKIKVERIEDKIETVKDRRSEWIKKYMPHLYC